MRFLLSNCISVLLVCFMVPKAVGSAEDAETLVIDKIVAAVNGEAITWSALENKLRVDYAAYRDDPRFRRRALEDLIEWKLMLQEAERYGKQFLLDETLIQKEREQWIRQMPGGTFEEALEHFGLSPEDVDENIRERIMIARMSYSKFIAGQPITQEDALEYYEDHKTEFVQTLIQREGLYFAISPNASQEEKDVVRRQAENAWQWLQQGQDFKEVWTRLEPLPYAHRISDAEPLPLESLIPVLANALSRLQPLKWSHLIETPFGFFILRLRVRHAPRQQSFGEVEIAIRERLMEQRIEIRLREWLEQAKRDADIRILDPELAAAPLDLPSTGLFPHGSP